MYLFLLEYLFLSICFSASKSMKTPFFNCLLSLHRLAVSKLLFLVNNYTEFLPILLVLFAVPF